MIALLSVIVILCGAILFTGLAAVGLLHRIANATDSTRDAMLGIQAHYFRLNPSGKQPERSVRMN